MEEGGERWGGEEGEGGGLGREIHWLGDRKANSRLVPYLSFGVCVSDLLYLPVYFFVMGSQSGSGPTVVECGGWMDKYGVC